ncbi:hypothetical protein FRC12_003746 [Ceratobasidium sp. 428]|nr:hypothetical protein FRC12_003746 [Ceratobasidium sp. 428]
MRDQSIVPAPINTLPVEILALIFKMAMPRCARNDEQQIEFYDPASVCAYWRRVATNALNLWTHIDAGPDTPAALTELLLKRTKGSPIHLHIYEPGTDLCRPTPPEQIHKIVDMLEPHMHQVCTLNIKLDELSLAAHVLENWLSYGSVDVSESLSISCFCADYPLLDGTENIDAARKENAVGMLRELSTLHLHGVIFDWNSSVYRGLADLRLDGVDLDEDTFISTSDFAKILSANPTLVVLKLANLEVRQTADWSQPAPILMNCLNTLNLPVLFSLRDQSRCISLRSPTE